MSSLREHFVFNFSFRDLQRIVRYVIKLRGKSLSQSEFTDQSSRSNLAQLILMRYGGGVVLNFMQT